MSKKSSFREALELAARASTTKAEPSATFPSDSDVGVNVLLRNVGIRQPVEVALTLKQFGLSLRKAHDAVNRLALGKDVPVLLGSVHVESTGISALGDLGVQATRISPPQKVDVRAIRELLGLSQAEFAARFGFEIDSIQNWEQGRYAPDRSALLLLTVIQLNARAVDEALGARGSDEVANDNKHPHADQRRA